MGELIENRIHLGEGREKMDIRESQKVKLRKPAQVRTEAGEAGGTSKAVQGNLFLMYSSLIL